MNTLNDALNQVLKYTTGLDGALVHAVLRPKGKTLIDKAALGVLGDHLQEIGNPLGKALSYAATGGHLITKSPYRFNGNTFGEIESDDGHSVFGREGSMRDGTPILLVGVVKKHPTDYKKTKIHTFVVPQSVVPEVAEWIESRKKPAPVTPDDIDHNKTKL